MKYIRIIFVVWLCLNSGCKFKNEDIVIGVNNLNITKKELDIRENILKLDSTANAKQIAILQLAKQLVSIELAKLNSFPITDSILKIESNRIENQTLLPEKIKKVKEICNNEENYKRLFVLEDFHLRWLQAQFENPVFHKLSINEATHCYTEVLINPSLLDFPFFRNHIIQDLTIGSGELVIADSITSNNLKVPFNMEKKMNELSEVDRINKQAFYNKLIKLNPNQIYPEIILEKDYLGIAKLVEKKGDIMKIKMLIIKKEEFSSWYEREIKKIRLDIYDKKTWNEMIALFPEMKNYFFVNFPLN